MTVFMIGSVSSANATGISGVATPPGVDPSSLALDIIARGRLRGNRIRLVRYPCELSNDRRRAKGRERELEDDDRLACYWKVSSRK